MLTELEKVQCRTALGYPELAIGVTISMGVPAGGQLQFLLELAMDRIRPQAETRLREVLKEIRCVELQLSGLKSQLATSQVEQIRFRPREQMEDLNDLFLYWVGVLSDILAVGPNPFSHRHRRLDGSWSSC